MGNKKDETEVLADCIKKQLCAYLPLGLPGLYSIGSLIIFTCVGK